MCSILVANDNYIYTTDKHSPKTWVYQSLRVFLIKPLSLRFIRNNKDNALSIENAIYVNFKYRNGIST